MGALKKVTTVKFRPRAFARLHFEDFEKKYEIDLKRDFISAGSNSRIYACILRENGEKRAVKITEKSRYDDESNKRIKANFELLKALDHPNILRVYECFENEQFFFMVTELCKGGELRDVLVEGSRSSEHSAALLMKQLLTCLNYCHQKSIVHLGLKPENILLNGYHDFENLTVIDFGNSILTNKPIQQDSLFGSPTYMAPEIVKSEIYGPKADVWACGVIAFEVLSGLLPFDASDDLSTLQQILFEEVAFDDPAWDLISKEGIDFVKALLKHDHNTRPTAEEALNHPWILEAANRATEKFDILDSLEATTVLKNMKKFCAQTKLKQAALAIIGSNLIQKDEMPKLQKVFWAIDTEKDGKLSRDEIKLGYKKFLGDDLIEQEVEDIFRQCNLSGTGYIEYSEFVVAAMKEEDVLSTERLQQVFSTFDVYKNGYITAEDLKRVVASFVTADESVDEYITNRILKQLNKRADTKICFDEFVSIILNSNPKPERNGERKMKRILSMDVGKNRTKFEKLKGLFEEKIKVNEANGFVQTPIGVIVRNRKRQVRR